MGSKMTAIMEIEQEPELRFFRQLEDNVDIGAMLDEIDGQEELWTYDTSRQDKIKCQRETNTIYLRSGKKPYPAGVSGNDVQESRPTRLSARFPVTLGWTENFAAKLGGELGRVAIVKLLPNGRVYRHIDHGEYYQIRDRYHLVLRSRAGSPLVCGDELVRMQDGEVWWLDNKAPHEAYNESDQGRIHLIFDVLPNSRRPSLAQRIRKRFQRRPAP